MANICQFTLKGTLEFNQFFFKVGCVWNKKEMYSARAQDGPQEMGII